MYAESHQDNRVILCEEFKHLQSHWWISTRAIVNFRIGIEGNVAWNLGSLYLILTAR